MMRNGYPRKFINKVVSSQIKRHTTSCALKRQKQTTSEHNPKTVSIPFVEGLSQEVALGAHFFFRSEGLARPHLNTPLIIADIFMEDLEDKTFATYDATPRVWYRFVDGAISVM